jgi:secreted trypsin-like serine protease
MSKTFFLINQGITCGKNDQYDGNFIAGAKHDPEHNPVGFWPWIASIGFFSDENEWSHQCGATLISEQHFLTAAHCVNKKYDFLIYLKLCLFVSRRVGQ